MDEIFILELFCAFECVFVCFKRKGFGCLYIVGKRGYGKEFLDCCIIEREVINAVKKLV